MLYTYIYVCIYIYLNARVCFSTCASVTIPRTMPERATALPNIFSVSESSGSSACKVTAKTSLFPQRVSLTSCILLAIRSHIRSLKSGNQHETGDMHTRTFCGGCVCVSACGSFVKRFFQRKNFGTLQPQRKEALIWICDMCIFLHSTQLVGNLARFILRGTDMNMTFQISLAHEIGIAFTYICFLLTPASTSHKSY